VQVKDSTSGGGEQLGVVDHLIVLADDAERVLLVAVRADDGLVGGDRAVAVDDQLAFLDGEEQLAAVREDGGVVGDVATVGHLNLQGVCVCERWPSPLN